MQTENERKIVEAVAVLLKKDKIPHRLDSVGRNNDGVAVWCDPDVLDKVEAAFLKCGAVEQSIDCREGDDDTDTWITAVSYNSAKVLADLERDLAGYLLAIQK